MIGAALIIYFIVLGAFMLIGWAAGEPLLQVGAFAALWPVFAAYGLLVGFGALVRAIGRVLP